VKVLPVIDPPPAVVDEKSSFCPEAAFHFATMLPVMVAGESNPAHPPAPLVLSVPESEPETIVGWLGVAPVTVQPPSAAFTLMIAVPLDAELMGGLTDALPMMVLHVTVAAAVLKS
jgi:hypothetical protein